MNFHLDSPVQGVGRSAQPLSPSGAKAPVGVLDFKADPYEKVTIGCNWSGDYYPVEYVNKLYRACKRNTTVPFDFIVYGGPKAEEHIFELDRGIRFYQTGRPSWWSGMEFWSAEPPGIDARTILYLDIDQVIVGSLDDIILFPSKFACMKDYPSHSCPKGRENDGNVACTLIRDGAGAQVWEEYLRAGKPTWDVLRHKSGPMRMAAQGVVNDPKIGMAKDLFPEEWVSSYKLEVLKRGVPDDCRIVSFHGVPKPVDVDMPFVKRHWI